MKNINKYFIILFVFLLVFNVPTFTFASEKVITKPTTEQEMRRFLINEYSGFFVSPRGNLEIMDRKNKRWLPLNTNYYTDYGVIYFGNASDVTKSTHITHNSRDSNGNYRFIGTTMFSHVPMPTVVDFIPDFKPSGDWLGKKYVLDPYKNRHKIINYSYKPTTNDLNDTQMLRQLFRVSGKNYTTGQVNQIQNMWALLMDDPYSRNHDKYRKNNENWIERTTDNQFLMMDTNKVRRAFNITQIPTIYSKGVASEWHWVDSLNQHLYDSVKMNAEYTLAEATNNFKTTKLDVKSVTSDRYEIYLSVKNDTNKGVNTNVPLPTQVKITIGKNSPIVYNIEAFSDSFKSNQTKVGYLGDFKINSSVKENTKIKVEAIFNPNKDDDFKETKYSDNSISKTVYTTKQLCNISGIGETKNYSVKTCTDWDSDGNCIRKGYTNHSISLKHEAKIDFNKDKQSLLGVWTRYGEHTNEQHKNVPKAIGTNLSRDEWNIPLTSIRTSQYENYGVNPEMINSLKELNVNKSEIRKLIRAGRSVELYGTMKVDLTIMSFDGESDINKRKSNFMKDLLDQLKIEGVKVAENVITNHEGDSKVKAQVDKDRTTSGNYITTNESKVSKTTFGDYRKVTRYEKTFSFVIPIESVNDGGEQETGQGGLGSDYEVGNALNSFYINISTTNDMYGLRLSTTLNGKKIDPIFTQNKVCYSPTEKFKVDGNIYDDVGSEDMKDTNFGEHDDEWDF